MLRWLGGGYSVKNVSLVKSPKTIHYDPYIHFQDAKLEAKCIELWSSDGIGLSYADAEAVTELVKTDLPENGYTSFDELKYFKNLTTIPSAMFYYWKTLKSITIPENVETCPVGAFDRCNKLERITWNTSKCLTMQSGYRDNYNTKLKYESDNPYFSVVNSCLYNANKTILYAAPSTHTSYEWLGTEREIYARAFYDSQITGNMIFPKTIDTIGDFPFYNAQLTSADLSKTNIKTQTVGIFRCPLAELILPSKIQTWCIATNSAQLSNLIFPATLKILSGRLDLMNSPILTFLGETPPTFSAQVGAGSIEHVYVPANAVDTYKAVSRLSYVKDLIEAIPE